MADVKMLEQAFDEIKTLIDGATIEDPIGRAVALIGIGMLREFLIDVKRLADAAEKRNTLVASVHDTLVSAGQK